MIQLGNAFEGHLEKIRWNEVELKIWNFIKNLSVMTVIEWNALEGACVIVILKGGNNYMNQKSRIFTCNCGSMIPIKKLEKHILKEHFDSNSGLSIIMKCI